MQQSYSLTTPNCPFEHEICPDLCYLYGNRCDFTSRLHAYQWDILNYGEIIGAGADPSDPILFPILRVGPFIPGTQ